MKYVNIYFGHQIAIQLIATEDVAHALLTKTLENFTYETGQGPGTMYINHDFVQVLVVEPYDIEGSERIMKDINQYGVSRVNIID